MCVGFWCLDVHEYSLVLCTNRDEYLSRPTERAHWHSFESLESHGFSQRHADEGKSSPPEVIPRASVLSGIDTLAGGTWFGINNQGEIALLTNITEPAVNFPSSRGHLCSSFLCRNRSPPHTAMSDFVTELTTSEVRYAGFNLLLLAPSHISRTSRSGDDPLAQATSLGTLQYDATLLSNGGAGNPIASIPGNQQTCGCNGISNGVPNGVDPFTGTRSSEWPKVVQGRENLSDILAKHEEENVLVERLFGLLRYVRNKTHSPPKTRYEFQETIMIDPVNLVSVKQGPSVGEQLDKTPPLNYYATRLSTVLLIRKTGEVLFIERDVWLSGTDAKPEMYKDESHERKFRFHL
ncbi:NRDE protein-domain-containing protein [Gautieria morchelliformis]|nr:NRDE protein-domain-containing protein [Gautieria morchelliformis]